MYDLHLKPGMMHWEVNKVSRAAQIERFEYSLVTSGRTMADGYTDYWVDYYSFVIIHIA